MSKKSFVYVALLLLCVAGVGQAAELPVAVSPGDVSRLALIGDTCPTFSWGGVSGAKSYELVVYRLGEEGEEAKSVLQRSFPGSVHSWTPSLNSCLERGGQYAWSVRAVGRKEASEWSAPSLFEIASGPSEAEFEEALQVVRSYLHARGEAEPETATAAVSPFEGQAASEETPTPLAPPQGTQMSVDGNVDATSFSGDGSGLGKLDASGLATGTVAPARGGLGFDASSAAPGSLLYTSAIGAWSTLPKGSDGQVLKLAAGSPTWASPNTSMTSLSQGTGINLSPNPITSTGTVGIDTTVPRLNTTNTFSDTQNIQPGSASSRGLVVRGGSGQTADLQQWQNSSGTKVTWVGSAGTLAGSGSGLTDLHASELSSGTIPSGRLSGTYDIDISGTASNVTGTVALSNGGTGATTAAGARTNLDVVSGPHTVDTDTDDQSLSEVLVVGNDAGGQSISNVALLGFSNGETIDNTTDGTVAVSATYLQIPTVAGTPPPTDCETNAEAGRLVFDTILDVLYLCDGALGWKMIS